MKIKNLIPKNKGLSAVLLASLVSAPVQTISCPIDLRDIYGKFKLYQEGNSDVLVITGIKKSTFYKDTDQDCYADSAGEISYWGLGNPIVIKREEISGKKPHIDSLLTRLGIEIER